MLASFTIHIYCTNELRVEQGYSSHFSLNLSHLLRYIFGSIPFSVGDIFYGLFIAWIIRSIIRVVKDSKQSSKDHRLQVFIFQLFLRLFTFCTSLYIIFNTFWGINYNRKGIAWQLGLKMEKYGTRDLKEMNCLLIDKINASKKLWIEQGARYPASKTIFQLVNEDYKKISVQYPFLQYEPSSIKPSLWGWLGNYTGFTGYYNPFTGEAQVNTTVPDFLRPFIACHEIAHQLGYAKEMEANFVGYLAASASPEPLIKYSVYLDLFTYANRNLFLIDSMSARLYRRDLDTAVINDYRTWFAFNKKHQSVVEPVVRWIYGKYLESNRQPQGLLSYDEVTAFIISYYKKFGRI